LDLRFKTAVLVHRVLELIAQLLKLQFERRKPFLRDFLKHHENHDLRFTQKTNSTILAVCLNGLLERLIFRRHAAEVINLRLIARKKLVEMLNFFVFLNERAHKGSKNVPLNEP
jgi:hypothetical protein